MKQKLNLRKQNWLNLLKLWLKMKRRINVTISMSLKNINLPHRKISKSTILAKVDNCIKLCTIIDSLMLSKFEWGFVSTSTPENLMKYQTCLKKSSIILDHFYWPIITSYLFYFLQIFILFESYWETSIFNKSKKRLKSLCLDLLSNAKTLQFHKKMNL